MEFTNGPNSLREHIAVVLKTSCLTTHGKGLAWGAARHQVDWTITAKVDVADITLNNVPARSIMAEGGACVGVSFEQGDGFKPRLFQPESEPAST